MAERLRIAVRRSEFALVTPLQTARRRWEQRSVLELHLTGECGATGRGEAAPLPGYSPDELDSVHSALSALELEVTPRAGALELVQLVERLLPASLPSARFALQTALLDRLALAQGRPLWSVLQELLPAGDEPARAIELSGLLSSAEPERGLAEAERLHAQGLRCFKIKIGPGRLLPAQAELLARLRERWGASVSLRLDANRSLTADGLSASAAELVSLQPELVEEPLAEPGMELLSSLPFDWALDESLQELALPHVAELCRLPRCRALVLKLTALGGFGAGAELARCARARGKAALVSHALDGPIGWLASAHFALALRSSAAAGLWPRADGAGSALFREGCLQPQRSAGLGAE